MLNAIYGEYYTLDKPKVLGENAIVRPGNLVIILKKILTPTTSVRAAYYQAALKVAEA